MVRAVSALGGGVRAQAQDLGLAGTCQMFSLTTMIGSEESTSFKLVHCELVLRLSAD